MVELSRRNLFLGGAAIVGVSTLMSKPGDNSGPRDPYFLDVQNALTQANIAAPTLVIDRARLNQNIDTLLEHLPDGMGYRIVAKSLPSLALIDHIRQRAGTSVALRTRTVSAYWRRYQSVTGDGWGGPSRA